MLLENMQCVEEYSPNRISGRASMRLRDRPLAGSVSPQRNIARSAHMQSHGSGTREHLLLLPILLEHLMYENTVPDLTIEVKTKTKVKTEFIPKVNARGRKAREFNSVNLAAHFRHLLEDQYIENVIRFYPPELIAMVESTDAKLKQLIRNAAEKDKEIAAICALVDSLTMPLDRHRDS